MVEHTAETTHPFLVALRAALRIAAGVQAALYCRRQFLVPKAAPDAAAIDHAEISGDYALGALPDDILLEAFGILGRTCGLRSR